MHMHQSALGGNPSGAGGSDEPSRDTSFYMLDFRTSFVRMPEFLLTFYFKSK